MPKTILLVDDETVVVDIARRKLQDRGFEVMTAYDGEEALAQLAIKIPDLIVVDIQMPKMNGYTFLMEKDKNPAFVGIPVITVTAYNEMEPLFKRHGVKAYLLKPLKLQELLDKIVEVAGPAV
jgi:CheY-like chemotaxis protein